MVKDLCIAENAELAAARVLKGDARNCSSLLQRNGIEEGARRYHVPALSSQT